MKDYKAIAKAREDYWEASGQARQVRDEAIEQAHKTFNEAQAKAWAIRKETIAKAGGLVIRVKGDRDNGKNNKTNSKPES